MSIPMFFPLLLGATVLQSAVVASSASDACDGSEAVVRVDTDAEAADDVAHLGLLQAQTEIVSAGVWRPQALAAVENGAGHAAHASGGRMLVLIVSCHAHASDWPTLIEQAEKANGPGGALILVGVPPSGEAMTEPYSLSLADRILMVNGSDQYDGLPEKMMRGFMSVVASPELRHFSHVFKLDDVDIIDFKLLEDASLDFGLMERAILAQPGDYFSPELGYLVVRVTEPEEYYVWKPVEKADGADGWYAYQIDEGSYWYDHPMHRNGTFTYANGGAGYILTRRAMHKLAEAWPLSSMGELSRTHVLEDWAVGKTLWEAGVKLIPVHLEGEPSFWEHSCPCVLPCEAPDEALLEEEASHCTPGALTCCFTPCKEVDGLCQGVVHAAA